MDDLSALTGQYKSSGSAGDSQLILADDDTITKEHIEYLELYFVFIYKYLSAVFYLFLSRVRWRRRRRLLVYANDLMNNSLAARLCFRSAR